MISSLPGETDIRSSETREIVKGFFYYGGMMKGEKLAFSDSGRWLRDVVIGYIKAKKVICPSLEGRITEIP